jgi:hypothetical protein
MQPATFLIAHHPQRGLLWASVDATARHTGSEIAETRFGAYLKPYSCEDAARAALTAAGGDQIVVEERKPRGRR